MASLVELRPGWVGLRLSDLRACPTRLALESPRCCVFVACDARGYSADELFEFGQRLLALGAVYVCAWGPECRRVEDAVDDAVVAAAVEHDTDDCVLTTAHPGDSLDDALWFFEHCARPADAYAATAQTRLVVAVGELDVLDVAR